MPRRLKDTELDSRTARLRLPVRGEPYWRRISRRCHLGYRRNGTGAGSWIGRFYSGTCYVKAKLGTADDELSADGQVILSFSHAQDAIQEWFVTQDRKAKGLPGLQPATVSNCLDSYLEWYRDHRRAVQQTTYTIEANIRPALGDLKTNDLAAEVIRKWHQKLATTPPRLRSAPGVAQQWGEIDGQEGKRRRKVTANRALTILKAALNHAFNEDRLPSDDAWRRIKPFKGVESARIRYLDENEAVRLLNSCDDDFRALARAALLTGARYGELTHLRVDDYRPEASALVIAESKSSKPRKVFLNEEGFSLFEQLTVGRPKAQVLFLRADGQPWGKSHQARRIREACRIAEIEPSISFHILRHTYASLYLMAGGSLPGLSAQLGHADTRMTTKHYGHLAESWRAEEAQQAAPSFKTPERTNVARIERL